MTNPISRLNAALEGRYRVERELGEGGMAIVYLADDLKHERSVALKVLKPDLAAVVGAQRFLAEIKTTANLQHPNVLPLFDSGEADGFLFYVMPYVEGESLRDRLDRERQLPVDEAVRLATEVADALQAAHENGVVHRDIKPANIMLSRGRPLVADFGIALAVSAAGGGRMTETGLSVGTPPYMSPEQASGDDHLGPAADIYALGCVLYEALVGQPPFVGTSAQAVLASVLTTTAPRAADQRSSVPPHVDAVIARALEKVPADRFATMLDLARALADPHFTHGMPTPHVAGKGTTRRWGAVATGALLLTVATVFITLQVVERSRPSPVVVRSEISIPDNIEALAGGGRSVSLAPDGLSMVFVGDSPDGSTQLWLRRLGEIGIVPLQGTENGRNPRISPDGERVAFTADGHLKITGLTGGEPTTVFPLEAPSGRGGVAWGPDGALYFRRAERGIWRIRTAAGTPEEVTIQAGPGEHLWPDVLPNGKALIFTRDTGALRQAQVVVFSLETEEEVATFSGSAGRYSASGHLFYVDAGGRLLAMPFDPNELTTIGEPIQVEGLVSQSANSQPYYDVSAAGTLVYRTGTGGTFSPGTELVWVTRDGVATPVEEGWEFASPTNNFGWRLSPSGNRVALTVSDGSARRILVKDLPGGPISPLIVDGRSRNYPVWTPDGQFISYHRARESGGYDFMRMSANGIGDEEVVVSPERSVLQGRYSPDESWIVFRTGAFASTAGGRDIVGIHMAVDTVLVPLAASPDATEQQPELSTDGRWLAYTSNRTGGHEVYVRPFPDANSDRVQVSINGGIAPLWAKNGQPELFFVGSNREMISARFEAGPKFEVTRQDTLFSFGSEYRVVANSDFYDVHPEGDRFLMARLKSMMDGTPRLVLVQNVFQELAGRPAN